MEGSQREGTLSCYSCLKRLVLIYLQDAFFLDVASFLGGSQQRSPTRAPAELSADQRDG